MKNGPNFMCKSIIMVSECHINAKENDDVRV